MNRTSPPVPSGRTVLAGLAGTLFVFGVTHLLPLPGTLHDVMRKNGGHTILDLQPVFSSQGVYRRLSSFGEAGREAYFRMMLSTDIVFPLAFTMFLGLLALYAMGKTRPRRAIRFLLLLLPFGYLIPDLAENLTIAWLIQDYPIRHEELASALGYITALKRTCMYAALFVPMVLLSINQARWRRRRN
ncbi:MAG TPA: hypothetical protein VGR19_00135 [Allosphingosinicella sp.]|nr:hypothetical protein [Allosphingosinicella sp.]